MFISLAHQAGAQTFAEWFQQKQTQIKYLIQQIGGLQLYLGYIKKGYNIADKGWNTVKDLKNGEFNLHKDYFNSLKTVNPAIKKYSRVAEIIALQSQIIARYKAYYQKIKETNVFQPDEVNYCHDVFTALIDDVAACIDELTKVLTNGEWEMTDDERMKRIDRLYTDMTGKYAFVCAFGDKAYMLGQQREQELNDMKTLKNLH
jgi:hypothetical protein